MYNTAISYIKKLYGDQDFTPLHAPCFIGNEKKYVLDTIESTFVSSVGSYVTDFEKKICELTGAKYAVATSNGTSALHIALKLAGVDSDSEVLTQALTFVATANAISYCNADPVFLDVSKETMGLDPKAVHFFLMTYAEMRNGICFNKQTGKKIAACLPMHSFGFPVEIEELLAVCEQYSIPLIEDAAESLGSFYKGKSTGTFGLMGAFSFNGNKIVTAGGGGCLVTNDAILAQKAKHITTTAKVPHQWEYIHDEIGYNYRLTNLNAALACAQLENLMLFVEGKRKIAEKYRDFFSQNSENIRFFDEPLNTKSNFWLNAIVLNSREERDYFLKQSNSEKVMTRPIWEVMYKLAPFSHCYRDQMQNTEWFVDRVVNIPSSVIVEFLERS